MIFWQHVHIDKVISDCTDDTICPQLNEIEDEEGDDKESDRTSSGRSLTQQDNSPRSGALFLQPPEDGALLASYSVFVVGELELGFGSDMEHPQHFFIFSRNLPVSLSALGPQMIFANEMDHRVELFVNPHLLPFHRRARRP